MSEYHNNIEEKDEVIEKDSSEEIETNSEESDRKTEIEEKEEELSENIKVKEKPSKIKELNIDLEKQRYPYCIVWTPMPCITWIFPSIGHAGICTSKGIILDFAGPYHVNVDHMAFGNPTKYIFLDIDQNEKERYDEAILSGKKDYKQQMYSFCCNNCHSFIARCLNKMNYKGKNNYTMVHVWWMLCIRSKFLNCGKFIKTYLGFFILLIIIGLIIFLTHIL